MTLAIPGGFVLDEAASPGWSQGEDDRVSFDPTAPGASPRLTGMFTEPEGTYTSNLESSISGYFGLSQELTTLVQQTPFTVDLSATPVAGDSGQLNIVRSGDVSAYLPPVSSPERPGIQNQAYSVWYVADVPEISGSPMSNVTVTTTVADGSLYQSGKIVLSNPRIGQIIDVSMVDSDGSHTNASFTVTNTDATEYQLPATDEGWVTIEATTDRLGVGESMKVDLTAHVRDTFASDPQVESGLQKASYGSVSGTDADTGDFYAGQMLADPELPSDQCGAIVTYQRRELKNTDLALQLGAWRSPYANPYPAVLAYGGGSEKLNPSWGGAGADTTTSVIYEPIMYFMLPRKTVLETIRYDTRNGSWSSSRMWVPERTDAGTAYWLTTSSSRSTRTMTSPLSRHIR